MDDERLTTARVARLATTDPDGSPHLVPIVFVPDGTLFISSRRVRPPAAGPSMLHVAAGEGQLWNGIVQVVVVVSGAALADVSIFVSVGPPTGVNVNVVWSAVGMKTDVLPSR